MKPEMACNHYFDSLHSLGNIQKLLEIIKTCRKKSVLALILYYLQPNDEKKGE